jgi:hypothetical protein
VTEHEGAEVESILVNKTKVGQASRQVWSGDVNLPDVPSLKLAQHGPDVILVPVRVKSVEQQAIQSRA